MLTATLRPIRDGDWPGVLALESAAYRRLGLSEDPDTLRSRAAAGTSFVVEAGGSVAAYLLALPYPYGRIPDLAEPAPVAAGGADLHLHDIVVDAGRRRAGLGGRLVDHLLATARAAAYARVSLVSVADSGAFWTRQGFHPRPEVPVPAGYGPGAAYLTRPL